jgi:hypothetical protein
LEDTGGSPLWDDAALNEFLAAAVRGYGACFPTEISTTVMVNAGVQSAVVSPVIEGSRVVRVFDAAGRSIPRRQSVEPGDSPLFGLASAQSWRWWGATLVLTIPASTTGSWQIDYLGWRVLPPDDVTTVDVIAGDEDIVVLLAVAAALDRRAVEDGKRGLGRSAAAMALNAAKAREAADALIVKRRRRAQGAWLSPV